MGLFRHGLSADLAHLPPGTPGTDERLREKANHAYTIPGTRRTRVAAGPAVCPPISPSCSRVRRPSSPRSRSTPSSPQRASAGSSTRCSNPPPSKAVPERARTAQARQPHRPPRPESRRGQRRPDRQRRAPRARRRGAAAMTCRTCPTSSCPTNSATRPCARTENSTSSTTKTSSSESPAHRTARHRLRCPIHLHNNPRDHRDHCRAALPLQPSRSGSALRR